MVETQNGKKNVFYLKDIQTYLACADKLTRQKLHYNTHTLTTHYTGELLGMPDGSYSEYIWYMFLNCFYEICFMVTHIVIGQFNCFKNGQMITN